MKAGPSRLIGKGPVYIIIGRAPAWRPKTDLAFCMRHLSFTLPSTAVDTDAQRVGNTVIDMQAIPGFNSQAPSRKT
jgi:hypothetical protein